MVGVHVQTALGVGDRWWWWGGGVVHWSNVLVGTSCQVKVGLGFKLVMAGLAVLP